MSCARCEEWQRICENLESQITGLREDTADRIEALEAALREIVNIEFGTRDHVAKIARKALAPEQDK
jgi:hypothetical protein